jgi:hypothetical protein
VGLQSPVPGSSPGTIRGISLREFARRDGCDPKLVREAVKKGRLPALPDRKLDPSLAGTGWRERNRRGGGMGEDRDGECPQAVPITDADLTAAAERLAADPACTLSMADAERLKENYLARLRQLEYDTKAGLVVPVAEVAAEVGQALATVRTKLLALPAEHAPRLHRLKTVPELQDALARLITEALEELSRAGALKLQTAAGGPRQPAFAAR